MDENLRQLDLLGTFHYVVAGMLALIGSFPIIHLIMGIAIVFGAFDGEPGNAPSGWIGIIFILMALIPILCMWALAAAVWLAGGRLKRHTNHTYCLVVAAMECMFMPFGTILGVLTIIVLVRPTVKALFGVAQMPAASS